MQDLSLPKPATLTPPKLQLGGVFVLLVSAAALCLLLWHHQFGLALLLLSKSALGTLFFRDTTQLREQHTRTSPANDITRRVAGALGNSLLLTLLLSLLFDLLLCSFATLLSA